MMLEENCDILLDPIKPSINLVSREAKEDATVIDVNGIRIGGEEIVMMAGPCAVESYEQLITTAKLGKEHGARILRGGAFKPRSSP